MRSILFDIRRYQRTKVLPFGTCQGDQDALFWDALDLVERTTSETYATLAQIRQVTNP